MPYPMVVRLLALFLALGKQGMLGYCCMCCRGILSGCVHGLQVQWHPWAQLQRRFAL